MSELAKRIAELPPPEPWQPTLNYPIDLELRLRERMHAEYAESTQSGRLLTFLFAIARLRDVDDPKPSERCYFAGPPAARYGDKIKIGTTTQDVRKRLSDLGNLVLLHSENGGRLHESKLHAQFARYRLNHEWFLLEGELASYVGIRP